MNGLYGIILALMGVSLLYWGMIIFFIVILECCANIETGKKSSIWNFFGLLISSFLCVFFTLAGTLDAIRVFKLVLF